MRCKIDLSKNRGSWGGRESDSDQNPLIKYPTLFIRLRSCACESCDGDGWDDPDRPCRGLLVGVGVYFFGRKQLAAEIAGRTCGALVRVWPEENHVASAKAQRERERESHSL